MFIMNKIFIVGAFLVAGCGSIEKAQLESNNPREAINEVQKLQENSRKNQADVLASDEFDDGAKYLDRAIKDFNNNSDREDVLKRLSQSKAYFLEANNVAQNRAVIPQRVLSARKATLKNGVREDPKQIRRLNEIDKSLNSRTKKFSRELNVEELSDFEQSYLKLEIDSIQNMELRVFRDIIDNARENDAEKIATESFRDAVTLLHGAENMIQQSPRNSENYRESVIALNRSAKLLDDVMNKLMGDARGSSEEVALQLVYQDRRLGTLSDRAGALQGQLSQSQESLDDTSSRLEAKTGEALASGKKVLNQNAMNDMRKLFEQDEADVYQQGNDLIIRLKNINFKTGSAEIPGESMGLLSKVNSVILNLDPSSILIEGHTDSTGGEQINQSLSVERSESVAKHFRSLGRQYNISSKGFGATRPIGNNQTTQGRAMNRRVDIVVSTI